RTPMPERRRARQPPRHSRRQDRVTTSSRPTSAAGGSMTRIVIVGGYGAFGALAGERLARDGDLEIVIAGRNAEKARAFADRLKRDANAAVTHATLDAATLSPEVLRTIGARILINASGPFQAQDYTVARAAIETRCQSPHRT